MNDRPEDAAGGARPTAGGAPADGAREVVASFSAYGDAVRAIDILSDEGFAVEHARIVAHDLRFVEQVTGRETTGRAMGRAAVSGLVFGALFGLLFGLLAWRDPVASGLILAVYGAILGAVVGAVVGAVGRRSSGGGRDFTSVAAMQAGGYDVMVDQPHGDEARRLLAATPPGR